jgi:exodeoxyribonuclease V alpha subunit
LQELAIARLPDFSPAWAITIHRSQGSEYENVLVVLPHEESPLATRELLYTAITRARRNVFVAGSLSAIRKAVLTPSTRTTLLAWHLGETPEKEEKVPGKVGPKQETRPLRTGELFPEWGD